MAIIKPGPLVSEARGKMGGVVFSRNKGGLYIRSFAAPTATATAARQRARTNFGQVSEAWLTLTPVQRQGWNDYGAQIGTLNSLGEVVPLSGLAAFVRGNSLLVTAGAQMRLDPPIAPTHGPILTHIERDGSDAYILEFTGNGYALVQVSPYVSVSRESYSGLPFRLMGTGTITGNMASVTNTWPLPDDPGTYYWFVRIRSVTADGRAGDPVHQRMTATVEEE